MVHAMSHVPSRARAPERCATTNTREHRSPHGRAGGSCRAATLTGIVAVVAAVGILREPDRPAAKGMR